MIFVGRVLWPKWRAGICEKIPKKLRAERTGSPSIKWRVVYLVIVIAELAMHIDQSSLEARGSVVWQLAQRLAKRLLQPTVDSMGRGKH